MRLVLHGVCKGFRTLWILVINVIAQHHHALPSMGAFHLPKHDFRRAGLRTARSAAGACWRAMPRTP